MILISDFMTLIFLGMAIEEKHEHYIMKHKNVLKEGIHVV